MKNDRLDSPEAAASVTQVPFDEGLYFVAEFTTPGGTEGGAFLLSGSEPNGCTTHRPIAAIEVRISPESGHHTDPSKPG